MAVYEIPLVSSNLRPQEMLSQMADTLEFLDQVSSDIFAKVTQQIQESRTRISNIHKRVEVAQAKIDGLKGSRKATKIFSSSRFPGNLQANSNSIFHKSSMKFSRTKVDYDGSESIVDGDMVFYPTHQQNGTRHQTPAPPSSVSELLIFNTEDLAFQRQSISDKSSKSTLRRKHDSEISTDTSIGEAPWSISSQRDQLERSNPLNFSYMPGLGDVPELDLPLALPDLPGVADDLAYNEDVGPGIAPSLIAALPDLSQLTENSKITKHSPVPPPPPPFIPAPIQSTPPPPPPPLTTVTLPPPPPPPAINLPLPPPPPPPPPPPAPSLPSVKASPSVSAPSTKPSALPLDRSNLMAAIREAGGAGKLKSSARVKHTQAVKEQQQQQSGSSKSSVSTSHQAPAGDLMADLFNKLSMRRKGISGQNQEVAGPMERISAMIPPPPHPAAANVSSSDEVEDWK